MHQYHKLLYLFLFIYHTDFTIDNRLSIAASKKQMLYSLDGYFSKIVQVYSCIAMLPVFMVQLI